MSCQPNFGQPSHASMNEEARAATAPVNEAVSNQTVPEETGQTASQESVMKESTAEQNQLRSASAEQPSVEELSATLAEYEKQIAALKQDVEDFRNRAMRWQAELENYQKRIARQLAEERKYAGLELIRDLLPVYDNLQRAAQSAEQNHDVNHVLEGLRMILKQWEDVLEKHNCRKIDALHQPFDPNFHHAISRQATGDVPPNTILYVAQDGFVLHDRVVRPSQVVVSMALPAAGGEGASESVPAGNQPEPSNNHPPT